MGLSDVSLGFDPSSAEKTPSVQAALEAYLSAVAALPGAEPVKTTWLRAHHLSPPVVVRQRRRIAEILANVVEGGSSENLGQAHAATTVGGREE